MQKANLCFAILCIVLICIGMPAVAQTSSNQNLNYYVDVDGKESGPYDETDLRTLAAQMLLTRSSLVRKEGTTNQVLAGTVEELAFLFISQPMQQTAASGDQSGNFTTSQRWATFGLNWLVPGLGSFVIMHDKLGGGVNLGLGVSGIACYGIGIGTLMNAKDDETAMLAFTFIIIAGGLNIATFVHNIVRSSTYDRPQPKLSLADPEAWQLAVIPGKDGIEAFAFSYKMRY